MFSVLPTLSVVNVSRVTTYSLCKFVYVVNIVDTDWQLKPSVRSIPELFSLCCAHCQYVC